MNTINKIDLNIDRSDIEPITDVITIRDTEQRVLNYMMISLENYNYINEILKDEDFTFLTHTKIFQYLFEDNDLLPKETVYNRFEINELEKFIDMFARLLEDKENVKYTSTLKILSKEPSSDIKKDIEFLKQYSFEKAVAFSGFKSDYAVIEVAFEDLNSFTSGHFYQNRLCSIFTTNIEDIPEELCDTAINTIKFLEQIDLNDSIYRASFSPVEIETVGITKFYIEKNYQLLEQKREKKEAAFQKLFDWADKYELDEKTFPRDINKLLKMQELEIKNKNIKELPKELILLERLFLLDLSFNKIKTIPKEFKEFKHLKFLKLQSNEIEEVPSELFEIQSLLFLVLKENSIISLPSNISKLRNLKHLCICQNKIEFIPDEITKLKKLEGFCMHRNRLSSLPNDIGELINLNTLTFSNNYIEEIPQSIIRLEKLESLEFENNKINNIDLQLIRLNKLNQLALDDKLLLSIYEPIRTSKKFDTINLVESKIKEDSRPIRNLSFKIETESWIDEIDRRNNGCIVLKKTE